MKLVNKANLAIVDCAGEETRVAISGVHFNEKGTVVTNGRSLIEVTYPNAEIKEFPAIGQPEAEKAPPLKPVSVPSATIKAVIKSLPKKQLMPILQHALVFQQGEKIALAVTDTSQKQIHETLPIDGTFPDYEKVFPQGTPAMKFRISAKLFREVLRHFETFPDDSVHAPVVISIFPDKVTTREGEVPNGIPQPILLESKRGSQGQAMRALVLPLAPQKDEEESTDAGDGSKAEETPAESSDAESDVPASQSAVEPRS